MKFILVFHGEKQDGLADRSSRIRSNPTLTTKGLEQIYNVVEILKDKKVRAMLYASVTPEELTRLETAKNYKRVLTGLRYKRMDKNPPWFPDTILVVDLLNSTEFRSIDDILASKPADSEAEEK